MYTGIVEGTGSVLKVLNHKKGKTLWLTARFDNYDLKLGDSISVNGVCLTISELKDQDFKVDIVDETLNKTTLSNLNVNSIINLERCARIGDRIGGHFVTAHIDGVGEIVAIDQREMCYWLTIKFPLKWNEYLVEKGSIAIDGMSITLVNVSEQQFTVTLIPYTLAQTIAKDYCIGRQVNLEIDLLAKHIYKLLQSRRNLCRP